MMNANKEKRVKYLRWAKEHLTLKKVIIGVSCLILLTALVLAVYGTVNRRNTRIRAARYGESIGRGGLQYKYGKHIYDPKTNKILLDSIDWLYVGRGDTIGIVAKRDKRAYINLNNAQLLTDLAYDKAWIFGSNRGVMVKSDSVYIFLRDGSQVNETPFPYYQEGELIFYRDQLVLRLADDKVGLLDTAAQWILPPVYSYIDNNYHHHFYNTKQGDICTVYSYDLKPVVSGNYRSIDIDWTEGIIATEYNGEQHLFDYDGNLLYATIFKSIRELKYDTGRKDSNGEPVYEDTDCYIYASYNGKKGLMNKRYQVLTPPLFYSIEAQTKYVFFAAFGEYRNDFGTLIDDHGKPIR